MSVRAVAGGKLTPTKQRAKKLTFGALPQSPADDVVLHCEICQQDYSAHAGDYCTRPPGAPPECGVCGGRVQLMRKRVRVTYTPVAPGAAERR